MVWTAVSFGGFVDCEVINAILLERNFIVCTWLFEIQKDFTFKSAHYPRLGGFEVLYCSGTDLKPFLLRSVVSPSSHNNIRERLKIMLM